MTVADPSAYLFSLIDYEKTPAQIAVQRYLNLDRMREALRRAGDPQRGLRVAHIAGTKGKGSTAAMLASILRAAGRRVGLYTSPHLVDFRERICVNGEMIGEADFAARVAEVRPLIESMRDFPHGMPTFFEAATLIALLHFARREAEIVVLETGMGGRLDATNVVEPLVTAITTIALDHTAELGDTLDKIAAEKAGIIKPGVPVVSAPQHPDAARVIARIAAAQGSPLYRVGEEIRVRVTDPGDLDGQRFTIELPPLPQRGRSGVGATSSDEDVAEGLFCPLLGAHQALNAAVAAGMAACLREAGEPVTPEAVRAGIGTVVWPGRLQLLRRQPTLFLDGAHDPAAMEALLAALAHHLPGRKWHFILGFSREKDWPRMLRRLAPAAAAFTLTAAANPRAVPPEALAAEVAVLGLPHRTAPEVATALADALASAGRDDHLCVTGSLFTVGDALKWWRHAARANDVAQQSDHEVVR